MPNEKKSERREFLEAMAKARSLMKTPTFDCSVNYGATRFKYASLGAVLDCVIPALLECNLLLMQYTKDYNGGVFLITEVSHFNGESVDSIMPIDMSGKCQDVGQRLTYYKRYSINNIFTLFAEDDTDGSQDRITDIQAKELEKLIGSNKEIILKILKAKNIKRLTDLSSKDFEIYRTKLIKKNGG